MQDKSEAKTKPEEVVPSSKKLIEEESSAEGSIKLNIILDYFKSAGIFMTVLTFAFTAIGNGKLIKSKPLQIIA